MAISAEKGLERPLRKAPTDRDMTTRPMSRAVTPPPYPHASRAWHKRLFEGEDIWRIAELVAARDSKLRVPEGVDVEAVADHLHAAFDNAMRSDLLAERSNDAGRLKGPWFQRLNRDAQRLIKTLGLTPEQCMDASRPLPKGWELPAICHLQAAADEMPGILWPHAEIIRALSGLPRIEQRMEAAERAFKDRGEPWDYRAQQEFLRAPYGGSPVGLFARNSRVGRNTCDVGC